MFMTSDQWKMIIIVKKNPTKNHCMPPHPKRLGSFMPFSLRHAAISCLLFLGFNLHVYAGDTSNCTSDPGVSLEFQIQVHNRLWTLHPDVTPIPHTAEGPPDSHLSSEACFGLCILQLSGLCHCTPRGPSKNPSRPGDSSLFFMPYSKRTETASWVHHLMIFWICSCFLQSHW